MSVVQLNWTNDFYQNNCETSNLNFQKNKFFSLSIVPQNGVYKKKSHFVFQQQNETQEFATKPGL